MGVVGMAEDDAEEKKKKRGPEHTKSRSVSQGN